MRKIIIYETFIVKLSAHLSMKTTPAITIFCDSTGGGISSENTLMSPDSTGGSISPLKVTPGGDDRGEDMFARVCVSII